jgi:hypothetical protein
MNSDIQERTSTNTATGYRAEDRTDPDFFIEASIANIGGETILSFVVLAVKTGPRGSTIRGKIKGGEFFDAMWAHFASRGTSIDVIQAEWTDAPLSPVATFTTNLDAFNKAIQLFSSAEDAALQGTPTGHYASKKGYTRVNFVHTLPTLLPKQNGPFTEVVVQFRRP